MSYPSYNPADDEFDDGEFEPEPPPHWSDDIDPLDEDWAELRMEVDLPPLASAFGCTAADQPHEWGCHAQPPF